MKTFRIIAGILAIIPLGLLVFHLIYERSTYDPNSIVEMAYLVFGVPILIINFWAWFHPEVIEFYFFGKANNGE